MLQMRLLYIGKPRLRWVQSGVIHYQKLIKPFAKLSIEEVKSVSGRYPEAELMRREAARFRWMHEPCPPHCWDARSG